MSWLQPLDKSYKVIASHFPVGIAWIAFRDVTKFAGRLIKSISNGFEDAWKFLFKVSEELDYRKSEQMLDEWEQALSLPDPCLPVSSNSIDDRRKWIRFRLDKKRWNTLQRWHELAALYGVNVRITPGYLVQKPSLFKAVFPIPIRIFPKLGRFRIYIDMLDENFGGFPYDGTKIPEHQFPIPFGQPDGEFSSFKCFIERIKPANVLIIWNEFPDIPPHGNTYTFSHDFDEEFS